MMKSIYDKMWADAFEKIKRNELDLDPLIDTPNDSRLGITLQAKPDQNILENFNLFLNDAKRIEPGQYYYLPDEFHITVMSVINCKRGFNLSEISLPDYIGYIERSINNIKPFMVEFKGITASPSCILIQGFPENNSLEHLRNNLRTEFGDGSLYNTIDSRYIIQTAHCTVIRFRQKLKEKQNFTGLLENYRNYYFGKTYINNLELVLTDWYHSRDIVRVIHTFNL
jgi:2'-5' RNA ligase